MKLGLISLNNGSNRRKQMHPQEDERNFQAKGQAWIPSSKRTCSLPSLHQCTRWELFQNHDHSLGEVSKKTPWKQLFGGKSTLLKL